MTALGRISTPNQNAQPRHLRRMVSHAVRSTNGKSTYKWAARQFVVGRYIISFWPARLAPFPDASFAERVKLRRRRLRRLFAAPDDLTQGPDQQRVNLRAADLLVSQDGHLVAIGGVVAQRRDDAGDAACQAELQVPERG